MFNLFKICKNVSDSKDYSLVQQLKGKQAAKKHIDDELFAFSTYNPDTLYYLMKFLSALENNGFRMEHRGYNYNDKKGYVEGLMDGQYGFDIIKTTLGKFSISDLEKIALELKTLRELISTIETKKSESATLRKEISAIKAQLGIE